MAHSTGDCDLQPGTYISIALCFLIPAELEEDGLWERVFRQDLGMSGNLVGEHVFEGFSGHRIWIKI